MKIRHRHITWLLCGVACINNSQAHIPASESAATQDTPHHRPPSKAVEQPTWALPDLPNTTPSPQKEPTQPMTKVDARYLAERAESRGTLPQRHTIARTGTPQEVRARDLSIPVDINQNTQATLSAEQLRIQTKNNDFYSALGLKVIRGDNGIKNSIGATANLAYGFNEQSAIGSHLFFSKERFELVLNALHRLPFELELKGSLGYMQGKQKFDFVSGTQAIRLQQSAYALSLQRKASDWLPGLQTIGLSAWGAKAKQRSNDAPVYVVQQTATSYNTILDTRRLAVGTLHGQAIDAQAALLSNLVIKGALGHEQISFPYSDGSKDRTRQLFRSIELHYEPIQQLTLSSHYQNGSSEEQMGLAAQYGGWKIASARIRGKNTVGSQYNVLLSYDFSISSKKNLNQSLAQRMQIFSNDNRDARLLAAATRPSIMPQNFLAKLDPTAAKTLSMVCKSSLGNGVTVNQYGQIVVPVGDGPLVLTQSLRNGTAIDNQNSQGQFSVSSSTLTISPSNLPTATATDAYAIYVTDAAGLQYRIEFTASPASSTAC